MSLLVKWIPRNYSLVKSLPVTLVVWIFMNSLSCLYLFPWTLYLDTDVQLKRETSEDILHELMDKIF